MGEMTEVMAEGRASVHAFEPNPHACALLGEKFAANPRVRTHRVCFDWV